MAPYVLFLLILGTVLEQGNCYPPNSFNTKIVGGEPAVQGQIPYILSLQINGIHNCGASIIRVQGLLLAISAAHCTMGMEDATKFNVTVVAGELKLSERSDLEQTRRVTQIVNHEFNNTNMKNDICLLFIDEPFQLDNNTNIIDLPPPGNATSGSIRVSGWGLLDEQGSQSEELMTVQIPIVNAEDCARAYAQAGIEIYDSMMCAGILGEGGKDSCQQDSGGPAVKDEKLIGIVSFGIGCARPQFPGVYTEVSYFHDWINETVATYLQKLP